ncbi:enterotoxin A family protein [Streptomyces sp. NPDC051555]|uniref:enterotoxin A family protein n=1 Tax=Streptomyces sp. NPDC051555 TaxID=3365657 RepID=UPI0037A3C693
MRHEQEQRKQEFGRGSEGSRRPRGGEQGPRDFTLEEQVHEALLGLNPAFNKWQTERMDSQGWGSWLADHVRVWKMSGSGACIHPWVARYFELAPGEPLPRFGPAHSPAPGPTGMPGSHVGRMGRLYFALGQALQLSESLWKQDVKAWNPAAEAAHLKWLRELNIEIRDARAAEAKATGATRTPTLDEHVPPGATRTDPHQPVQLTPLVPPTTEPRLDQARPAGGTTTPADGPGPRPSAMSLAGASPLPALPVDATWYTAELKEAYEDLQDAFTAGLGVLASTTLAAGRRVEEHAAGTTALVDRWIRSYASPPGATPPGHGVGAAPVGAAPTTTKYDLKKDRLTDAQLEDLTLDDLQSWDMTVNGHSYKVYDCGRIFTCASIDNVADAANPNLSNPATRLTDEQTLNFVREVIRTENALAKGTTAERNLVSGIESSSVISPEVFGRTTSQTEQIHRDNQGQEIPRKIVIGPTSSRKNYARPLAENSGLSLGSHSYVQWAPDTAFVGQLNEKPFVILPRSSLAHELVHAKNALLAIDKSDSVRYTFEGREYRLPLEEVQTLGANDLGAAQTAFLEKEYGTVKDARHDLKSKFGSISELIFKHYAGTRIEELREAADALPEADRGPARNAIDSRTSDVKAYFDINDAKTQSGRPYMRSTYRPAEGDNTARFAPVSLSRKQLDAQLKDPKGSINQIAGQINPQRGTFGGHLIPTWVPGQLPAALSGHLAESMPEAKQIARQVQKDLTVFAKTSDILSGRVPVLSGGTPSVVYRVDSRSPEQIRAAGGFTVPGAGTDNDVYNHIWDISTRKGNGETNIVSTSQDLNQMVAQWVTMLGGDEAWVYVIATDENFVSVESELRRIVDAPGESPTRKARALEALGMGGYQAEWDARGGIGLDQIHLGFRIGIKNANVAPVQEGAWFNREGYEKSRSKLLRTFAACSSSRQKRDALCQRIDPTELRAQAKYYGIENEASVQAVLGPATATKGTGPDITSLSFDPGRSHGLTMATIDSIVLETLSSGQSTPRLNPRTGTGTRRFPTRPKGFARRTAGKIDSAADIKDLALYLKGFYDLVASGDAEVSDYIMHGIQIIPGVGNALGLKESVETGDWEAAAYHGGSLALLPFAFSNPYVAAFLVVLAEVWDEYQNHKNWERTKIAIQERMDSFKASWDKGWTEYVHQRLLAVLQLSAQDRENLAATLVMMRETAVQSIALDFCKAKFYNSPADWVAKYAARKGANGVSACMPRPQGPRKQVLVVNGVSGDPLYEKQWDAWRKIDELDAHIAQVRSFFGMDTASPGTVNLDSVEQDISTTLRTGVKKMVDQGVYALTEELAGAQDGNYPNLINFAMWIGRVDNTPSPTGSPSRPSQAYINGRWRTYGMEDEILGSLGRIGKEAMRQCEDWLAEEAAANRDGRLVVLRVSAASGSGPGASGGAADLSSPGPVSGGHTAAWSVSGVPVAAFEGAGTNVTLAQEPTRMSTVLAPPVRHGHPALMVLKGSDGHQVVVTVRKTRKGRIHYKLDGEFGMRLGIRMSDGRRKDFDFTHQTAEHTLNTEPGVSMDLVVEDAAARSVAVHVSNSPAGNRPEVSARAGARPEDPSHASTEPSFSWNGPQKNELFYTFGGAGDVMELNYRDGVRLVVTYLGGGQVRYETTWATSVTAQVSVRVGDTAPEQKASGDQFETNTATPVTLIRTQ